MSDIARLSVVVDTSQARTAERDLQRLERQGGQLERGMDGMSRTAARLGTALAAAFSVQKVMDETNKAITAFANFERQMLRLDAQIIATGRAGQTTAAQLEAMAQRIDKATMQSAEGVRQAQAVLMSFRNIGTESMERVLMIAADVAEVMGRDIVSASRQMAIALEDPTRGLGMLRRTGTTFTEAQEKLIKSLHETGQSAKAQSEILKVMEQQYGGTASRAAEGLAGAMDNLQRVMTNLRQEIGEQLAPSTGKAVDAMADFIEENQKMIALNIGDIVTGIGVAFAGIKMPIDFATDAIRKLIEEANKLTDGQFIKVMTLALQRVMPGGEIIGFFKDLGAAQREAAEAANEFREKIDRSALRGRVVWPEPAPAPAPREIPVDLAAQEAHNRLVESWRLAQMTKTQIALEEARKRRDAYKRITDDHLAVDRWYQEEVVKILAADPVIAERLKGLEEQERIKRDAVEQFRRLKMTETELALDSLHQQYLQLQQHVSDKVALEIWYQQERAGIIAASNEAEEAQRQERLARQRAEQEAWLAREHEVMNELRATWGLTWEEIHAGAVNAWHDIGQAAARVSQTAAALFTDVLLRVRTAEDAAKAFLKMILRTMTETLIQIGVQQLLLLVIGKKIQNATAALTIGTAGAIAAAAAPAAKLMSIATFGAAPKAGAAAFGMAMASMAAATAATRAVAPLMDRGGITEAGGWYRTGDIKEAHIPIPAGGKVPVEVKERERQREAPPATIITNNINISALDSRSFFDVAQRNPEAIINVVGQALQRNTGLRGLIRETM